MTGQKNHSDRLFSQASRVLVGGVNSPVRSARAVGGSPLFIERATGPFLYDADEQRYVDYVCSWGAIIVGHADNAIAEQIQQRLQKGLSFGAPTALETALAEQICSLYPSIERLRLVSSGSEAVMSAIRLARACSGRELVVKFAGCYHGHSDSMLVAAGSAALTLGVPSSPGVPVATAAATVVHEYNDSEAIEQFFSSHGDRIAAVIVEPVAGNMGMVLPQANFLSVLRNLCDRHDSLLIFDEVMSGCRVALGGAEELYQIRPDICVLGKVIGGGMPLAAFGGARVWMEKLSPEGPVYQAGTLAGNPIACAAGLASLQHLVATADAFPYLGRLTTMLTEGMAQLAREASIPLATVSTGGMFGLFFGLQQAPTSLSEVQGSDSAAFSHFYRAMRAAGCYFAPSPFEAGFVTLAHRESLISDTLEAAQKIFLRWPKSFPSD